MNLQGSTKGKSSFVNTGSQVVNSILWNVCTECESVDPGIT